AITLSSQTGFNEDSLWSAEDYNRFNTAVGAFLYHLPEPGNYNLGANATGIILPDPSGLGVCVTEIEGCSGAGTYCTPGEENKDACAPYGVFCDPQLGCSNRLVAEDLSEEHSWQLSQEFRFASHFAGPFNFSIGGNYLHYETEENYYVFINSLTAAVYTWTQSAGGTPVQTLPWVSGVSDNSNCIQGRFAVTNPNVPTGIGTVRGAKTECMYLDPNPIDSLNNQGHN